MQTRLTLNDTVLDIFLKMFEGNIGALKVLKMVIDEGGKIDPDSAMAGVLPVLSLDTLGFYGSRIWMLYKDVCAENLSRMLAVLRANQLGFLTDEQLHHAVDNDGAGINVPALCARVVAKLPNFQLTP